MIKILHTSDLHFRGGDDYNYSIHVWKEVLNTAEIHSVQAILISGDVFDTFYDLETQRHAFLEVIGKDSPPIYAIAGNHEYLRKPDKSKLESFDLRPIHWFYEPGFHYLDTGSQWELVAVPFSPNYNDYRNWNIPPKKFPRFLMAHGLIPESMIYTGSSEEDGDNILELDLLRRFQPDYTALGHIHKETSIPNQGFPLHYSGSPGVWRKGEKGIRSVNLITIDTNSKLKVEKFTLPSVGEYRELEIQVLPNGSIPDGQIDDLLKKLHYNMDSILIRLTGVTDNETDFNNKLNNFKNSWSHKFREFSVNSANMSYMDGISDQPLVKKFLRKWEEQYKSFPADKVEERLILEEARMIGLKSIMKNYK